LLSFFKCNIPWLVVSIHPKTGKLVSTQGMFETISLQMLCPLSSSPVGLSNRKWSTITKLGALEKTDMWHVTCVQLVQANVGQYRHDYLPVTRSMFPELAWSRSIHKQHHYQHCGRPLLFRLRKNYANQPRDLLLQIRILRSCA
jgi:hypothetical protein